jgi:AraC-like DNA-binding protein/mannose-6-phosphate isomerase-like protein (cupin superfamily)
MPHPPTHPRSARLTWRGGACLLPELRMVGWDAPRRADSSALDSHAHRDAFEICYIVDGRVEWWVRSGRGRNDVFVLEPGHVFLTRPGEEHGGVDSVLHPCELYWLQVKLPRDGVPGMPPAHGRSLAKHLAGLSRRTFRGSDRLCGAFARIVSEHASRDPWSAAAARAALHELLALVCREHDAAPAETRSAAGAVSPAVRDAMRWMMDHLSEEFDLNDVAGAVRLTPAQLHHRFHKELGYTPGDWRTRQRVGRAKQLLADPARSVLDVAMQTGFSSSQYFATAFKRTVGLTPRQYRHRPGA